MLINKNKVKVVSMGNMLNQNERLEEVLNSMQFLKAEGDTVEVRILNTYKGTVSGYYNNYELLAKDINAFIGNFNIYFTLNPVKRELLSRAENHLAEYSKITTADADIEKRTTLMIDFDARRPAGISSSDEEHQKALDKAGKVKEFLTEQGWSEPVVADSGNGAHLLYSIYLPNDKESTELVKAVLQALDALFSYADVEVDRTTFNAARICKVYGTLACKGDDTEDRPHRLSKVLSFPEEFEIIPEEKLKSLVSMLPCEVDADAGNKDSSVEKRLKFDAKKWMDGHGIEVFQEKSWGNANLFVLKQCPWRQEHTNNSAYIIQYGNGAVAAGCHHNSCSDENWQTLRDKVEPGWRGKSKPSAKKGGDENQADILIRVGSSAKVFRDELEERYAAVPIGGHTEVYKINSTKFRMWLTKGYFEETGKAPQSDAMNQALGVFEMKAAFGGDTRSLSRRCAKYEDKYYYDLADGNWRNVVISREGWQVVDNPPILFVRGNNMMEQVEPEVYQDLSILNKHYRFKNKEDEILHMVNIVTKFIPEIAHPVDVIYGEKGASKTTSMRKDRSIVDPAPMDIVTLPSSKNDLALNLSQNYMPCYDNLDNITPEKSDILCMAATGGGISKRTLYTNEDETILYFKRPVILNGINIVATRPDLLDRALLLELERIPPEERKDEETIWSEFNRDKPKILGAIFATLSKAMTIYDDVKLDRMGRMADFTKRGYAIAEAAGIGGDAFLDAYITNQIRANEEAVDSNPVAAAIRRLMIGRRLWEGSVSELLVVLIDVADREGIDICSRLWPRASNALSRRLNEIKSNLELLDIRFDIRHHSSAKKITIINAKAINTIIEPAVDEEPFEDFEI